MKYSINDVSELTGATPRTIRYWIARGVLMRPKGVGRSSYYTDDHLERIGEIQQWADDGMTLDEIKIHLQLDDADGVVETKKTEQDTLGSWRHLPSPPELLILIRYDLSEDRAREIEEAVDKMNKQITRKTT